MEIEKHKLAFVIYSLSLGGAERVVTTLANNFISKCEVTIITFVKIRSFYNVDSRIKVIPCFNDIKPSSGPIEALQGNYSLFKRLNSVVKDNKYDILISFMTTANVLTTLVGKFNGIPVIISERTNPYHQRIPTIWRMLRWISYRYSDMLIVQTATIKTYFEGKIKPSKIRILPNPISIDLTNKRVLNKVSERKNIILSVGRLIKSKAFEVLIKAFTHTNYNNWELWIAGEGPEHLNLQDLVNELKISNHVKLLGSVQEIPAIYNASKIFAFSSTYEGFPNALIEAMHFGLACVSTDCPTGPSDLINDGENGFLVPINDIDEMSLKLNLLMKNNSIIDIFGKKSMAMVQPYEEENVAKQWQSIIESCLIK